MFVVRLIYFQRCGSNIAITPRGRWRHTARVIRCEETSAGYHSARGTVPVADSTQATSDLPTNSRLNLSHNRRAHSAGRRRHRLPPDLWPEIQTSAKHEMFR